MRIRTNAITKIFLNEKIILVLKTYYHSARRPLIILNMIIITAMTKRM
jgi:hypothetical protein